MGRLGFAETTKNVLVPVDQAKRSAPLSNVCVTLGTLSRQTAKTARVLAVVVFGLRMLV